MGVYRFLRRYILIAFWFLFVKNSPDFPNIWNIFEEQQFRFRTTCLKKIPGNYHAKNKFIANVAIFQELKVF